VEVQLGLIESDIYSIDTNVFLDIWCPPEGNIYSKQRMPELWEYIEKLVDEGRIIATKEVYDELTIHASSDLKQWLEDHKSMFVLTEQQVGFADNIINNVYIKYKGGFKPELRDAADPFVVALALTCNATVLTQEQRQDPHDPAQVNGPKIPTVCAEYNVGCVNLEEFISKEGFSIRMIKK
jgi:predicted nucleic acid-binding protein